MSAALLVAGCGDDGRVGEDAGSLDAGGADADVTATDASMGMDAGRSDAGAPVDAGPVQYDFTVVATLPVE